MAALSDITNVSNIGYQKTCKKRLVDGKVKTYKYTCARRHIELSFPEESSKLVFDDKLDAIRKSLGCKSVKDALIHIVDNWDLHLSPQCATVTPGKRESSDNSFMTGPGQDTPVPLPEDVHDHFIGQFSALPQLCTNISVHQQGCRFPLIPHQYNQQGHVAVVQFRCLGGHCINWSSSDQLGNNYVINYRMMMTYLCSGITPIQYERFCDFADIGKLTDHFLRKTLVTVSAVVDLMKKESIIHARSKELAASGGKLQIMTDARHACQKTSYHTDHVALGAKTHTVIDLQHINKLDDRDMKLLEFKGCIVNLKKPILKSQFMSMIIMPLLTKPFVGDLLSQIVMSDGMPQDLLQLV